MKNLARRFCVLSLVIVAARLFGQTGSFFGQAPPGLEQVDFPILKGPYLGQKPPGMTPEIFAPGIVSKEGIQTKLSMAADGSEIIYCERDPANNSMAFISLHKKGSAWANPVVLPFSREYMNMEPSLSPDGKKLLFVSNRPVSGKGEAERTPDIWMAEKDGDGWGEPVHVGPPVDAAGNSDIEAHPFLGSDGSLYFMRQAGQTRRLLHSQAVGGRFAAPAPVPLLEDLFKGQFSGPSISPDDRIMIMHSRKEGGFGGWDLYVSFKDDSGRWGQLVNLGPAINTDKPEADASFSPDGQYLFFPRDGDIFWVAAQIIGSPGQKKMQAISED